MYELKPCPFCGSKAEWVQIKDTIGNDIITFWKIQCSKCKCSTYPHNYIGGKKEELIKQWNTRKPIDTLVKILDDEYDLSVKRFNGTRDYYYRGMGDALDHISTEIAELEKFHGREIK